MAYSEKCKQADNATTEAANASAAAASKRQYYVPVWPARLLATRNAGRPLTPRLPFPQVYLHSLHLRNIYALQIEDRVRVCTSPSIGSARCPLPTTVLCLKLCTSTPLAALRRSLAQLSTFSV